MAKKDVVKVFSKSFAEIDLGFCGTLGVKKSDLLCHLTHTELDHGNGTPASDRMSVTREEARALITLLQEFVDEG